MSEWIDRILPPSDDEPEWWRIAWVLVIGISYATWLRFCKLVMGRM